MCRLIFRSFSPCLVENERSATGITRSDQLGRGEARTMPNGSGSLVLAIPFPSLGKRKLFTSLGS